jgi:hypothetical protein
MNNLNLKHIRTLAMLWAVIFLSLIGVEAIEAGPYSTGWTHTVETPNGILYYNAQTGAGAVGRINSAGNHVTIK